MFLGRENATALDAQAPCAIHCSPADANPRRKLVMIAVTARTPADKIAEGAAEEGRCYREAGFNRLIEIRNARPGLRS